MLYGQSEFGIADQLGIHIDEAKELLEQHRLLFPAYHAWSRRIVQTAYDRGKVSNRLGWQCRVPPDSKYRTWSNWPIQSTGADIMRLTIIYLDQQNIFILAPVHDGFLLTCRREEEPDLRAVVDAACTLAVKQTIGDFPLRLDINTYKNRFEDKDGKALWNLMGDALTKLYPTLGLACSARLPD